MLTPGDADGPTGSIEGPDGVRTFHVRLPDAPAPGAPLLVALHGFTQGSTGFESYTGLAEAAAARGIVTVLPDGIEDSWNGGSSCCPPATRRGVDDVGFLRALTAGLQAELDLDQERTWAVGFSNGGFLALRTACEAPEVFAAVVSHAGTMDLACEPEQPVSVLLSHGDRDGLIPFDGGRGPVSPQAAGRGARDVFAAWRELDGCPEPTPRRSRADEELLATPCDDGTAVGLAVWAGVGHVWPSHLNALLLDWLEEDAARRP
ncbi:MAG: prolyl oligopeptidase family serine peptidase [Actinobacteria bacterium]|nr:prolyl oligopeptidase family serine peptidase [Actinomycetota bacterium]